MAWWNKVISAAKSAVNKVVSTVKSVAKTISSSVSKAVSSAKSAVSKVASSVKSSVSKTVSKASSSVKKVATTIKNITSNSVEKVKDSVAAVAENIKNTITDQVRNITFKVEDIKGAVEEKTKETLEKVKEKIERLGWREKLLDAFKFAKRIKLPFIGVPRFDAIDFIYTTVTGKVLTETESIMLKAKALDWIVPMNALLKLFTGKNLDGKPEEFGTAKDYTDIALALLIFVPVGKVGAVAGKLGIKAGTKLGLKGFTKLAVTKIDDAARLFKLLNVDDQAKLIGSLSKTDEGVKIINKLLAKKALNPTLVKPAISIVNAEIKRKILLGKPGWAASKIFRFNNLLRAFQTSPGLKLLKWAIIGTIGVDGIMAWLASDNIITGTTFTLRKLSEAAEAGTITKEEAEKQLNLIQEWKDKATNFVKASTIANPLLWLFRGVLLINAEKGQLDIDLERKKIEAIVGLIEIPETVTAIVRDIIDGDTIDTGLDAKNAATGREIKLPEYRETGHARIRIVGINAPEKSPKGEILCTDIEIVKVEKKFADESRDRLLPLNDKEVILKIDPEISLDTYNRILAVVEFQGQDIGLRQINEGLACGYYREPHKYYDEAEYSAATLAAKGDGIGMWAGLEEIEKEEDKIKIRITSIPDNAKLFLDDVALRHNTPSDEVELSDMIHLFTLGKHILSAEKGGLSAMQDIVIVKGDNGTIHLDLVTEPFPEVQTEEEIEEEELEEELVEEEIEEEEIVEPVIGPVKLAEIPKEYTDEQAWALKEAFEKILILTEGTAIMSEKEREDLINSFNLYTTEQKVVLELLWRDLFFYTEGVKQLSADEFILLKEKYRMI